MLNSRKPAKCKLHAALSLQVFQKRMDQHFSFRKMTLSNMNKLISLIATLALLTMSSAGYSQNETAITLAPASLESDYQNELDKWMLQAYEGDRDAQFKVGVLFTNDQFQSADLEQSAYWYKQAARQGHALAQYNLGHQYLTGTGVKRNEDEAMRWWLKSAEQDHPLAQFNIGRAYYLGIGLSEDHDQSRFWFRRAAQNNEPKSIDILKQLNWAEPGEYQTTSDPNNNNSLAADATETSTVTDTDTQAALSKAPDASSLIEDTISPQNDTISEGPAAEPLATTIVEPIDTPAPITVAVAAEAPEQATEKATVKLNNPIALYTNPAKRSVLISIFDFREQLTIVDIRPEWTEVSSIDGFPVWVHRDFIDVSDDIGTISGNSVNARAVPLLTSGTIVGRLNNDEIVIVLDKKDSWYRVSSPSHFKAWVKTDEFDRNKTLTTIAQDPIANNTTINQTKTNRGSQTRPKEAVRENTVNDNIWLFSQPADGYTLQLVSFDQAEKVAAFKARKKFRNNRDLHTFTSKSKGVQWTYFLYGAFESIEVAKQNRVKIGQDLAWVRSFGKLQQNRCLAWKKQIPTSRDLNKYCS